LEGPELVDDEFEERKVVLDRGHELGGL
jgi:hypothetical protein